MSIPLTQPLSVKWIRGPRTASSLDCSGKNGKYDFSEQKPLVLMSTLYQDKGLKFQKKQSQIVVRQVQGKSSKVVGLIELDLGEYASPMPKSYDLDLKLQKCTDKNTKLKVVLSCKWLKELQDKALDDTASMVSELSTLDVDPNHGEDIADLASLQAFEEQNRLAPEDDEELPPLPGSPIRTPTRTPASPEVPPLFASPISAKPDSTHGPSSTHSGPAATAAPSAASPSVPLTIATSPAPSLSFARPIVTQTPPPASSRIPSRLPTPTIRVTSADESEAIANLQKQVRELEVKCSSLQAEKEGAAKEKKLLQGFYDRVVEDRDKAQDDIKKYKDVEALQSNWATELAAKDSQILKMKQELAKNEKVEEQLVEAQKQNEYHQRTISDLQVSQKELQINHETALHAAKRESARLEEKVQATEAELTKVRKSLTDIENTLHMRDEEVNQLTAQNSAKKRELHESAALNKHLQDTIDSLSKEISSSQQFLTRLRTENETLTVQIKTPEPSPTNKAKKVDAEAFEAKNKNLEEEIAALKEKDERNQGQLTRLQTTISKTRETLTTREDELNQLKYDLSQLRMDIQELNTSKRSLQQELMAERQRADDLVLKVEDLESLVESEKALRVKAEERATSLMAKLQDETQKFAAAKTQLLQQLNTQAETHATQLAQAKQLEAEIKADQSKTKLERRSSSKLDVPATAAENATSYEAFARALQLEIDRINKTKVELEGALRQTEQELELARSALKTERASREQFISDALAHMEKDMLALKVELDIKTSDELEARRQLQDTQRELREAEKSLEKAQDDLDRKGGRRFSSDADEYAPPFSPDSPPLAAMEPKKSESFFQRFSNKDELKAKEDELKTLREKNKELQRQFMELQGKTVFFSPSGVLVLEGSGAGAEADKIRLHFEKRIAQLQSQLQQAEEANLAAKESWLSANQMILEQHKGLDHHIADLKVQLVEKEALVDRLQTQLDKAVSKMNKMSEYMNTCEVQLVQKKLELVNTIDALSNMEFENNMLKQAVAKSDPSGKSEAMKLLRATLENSPGAGITAASAAAAAAQSESDAKSGRLPASVTNLVNVSSSSSSAAKGSAPAPSPSPRAPQSSPRNSSDSSSSKSSFFTPRKSFFGK